MPSPRLVVAALLYALVTTATADTIDVDSLLAVYSTAIAKHTSFTAAFTQSRHLAMFPEPLVSTGTITFAHPGSIRLHYKTPFEAVILLHGGKMKRYRIQDGAPVEQPSLEVVSKAITEEMARWFSADFTTDFPYDVSLVDNDPRHLRLKPQNAAARALFRAIELTFPDTPEYIQTVTLVETNGDKIVIEHEQPSFAPVDLSTFSVEQ